MTYLRNRYYDPATGCFTQEDPIGLAGGMNLYGFAGGDRVNFSDPFGLCPVCIVAGAWALYELGSSAYDVYTAGKTLASPTASGGEKAAAVGLVALSVIGPGGGYTAALDDLSDAAKALDRGGLTKAGRAYEKHAGRTSSKAMGNIAAKNAAGQALVDDILTSPGARTVPLTTGRFRGGFDIYAPDGRGVRYDKSGGFVGLLEPPRK